VADRKTILLVEDTPELLETLRQVLEAAGYKVICASDGEEALKVLPEQSCKIDMLITDLFIGSEMDGHSLSRVFLRERPNLRVLFISGGGPNQTALSGEFIQKPFSGKTLLEKIRANLV
jgi:DNA-binding response OmpR family regulator